MVTMGSP